MPTVICLILSIVSISTCKFAQVKADSYEGYPSVKLKYGIFSFYDPFEGECKAYADIGDDDDGWLAADYDTSSRQKWAQSLAIITILILTSSIICMSVLLFRTSCKIKILNQILLITALVTGYTTASLLYRESFNDVIKTRCDERNDDCDFKGSVGGILQFYVQILLIITLIISWIFHCKKESEPENNDTSEKVDKDVAPQFQAPQEEEP